MHTIPGRLVAADLPCSETYVTASIVRSRLGFNDDMQPDSSPTYGCATLFSIDCVASNTAYSYIAANDGDWFSNTTRGLMSAPVNDFYRYRYVYFQVELVQALTDIFSVELWSTTNGSFSAMYIDGSSIWLSPTDQYSFGISCATNITLVDGHNEFVCATTLLNARYVTVERPLGYANNATYDRLHIWELKVHRYRKSAPHAHDKSRWE